ncbi:MAG TPA: ATP-binding protein [Anaerolineales bacterium]|nr:ATP-binding protein [Anaerolineales bacterium]
MTIRSIRLRLALSFAAIAFIAAVVLGAALLAILQKYYLDQEITYLSSNAQVIAKVVSSMLSHNTPHDEVQSQIENLAFFSQTRVQVYDPSEQLLYDSGSPQNISVNLDTIDKIPPAQKDGTLRRVLIFSTSPKQGDKGTSSAAATPSASTQNDIFFFSSSETLPVASSPFGFDLSSKTTAGHSRSKLKVAQLIHDPKAGISLGSVRLSEGPDYGSTILQSVARGWGFASIIAVLLAAGIGWYISRRISAPVLALRDVTEHMAQGNLSGRANVESRDEFGQLALSFNKMADQVETTVATLRTFVSDAAHELRTPLTVLRTNLDLMLDEKDAVDRAVFVTDAKAMVQRLEELTTNLLDLSHLEARDQTARDTIVDLTELLQARSELYASQADQAGLVFEQSLPAVPVLIHADETEIVRAIDNLVDNACKFTPQAGIVRIALLQQDGEAALSVTDTGIGIPEDDLPHLFNRFHRGRNTTAYTGSGLGLAIVKAIVTVHQGRIEVESLGEGKGSKFTIRIPVAGAENL